MKPLSSSFKHCAAVSLTLALACSTALAGKPEWAGNGNGNGNGKGHHKSEHGEQKQAQQAQSGGTSVEIRIGSYFEDRQRKEVQSYYSKQSASGKCPPGLAKKNNGCLPPGQAKKWAMGKALPRDVVFYPVPDSVVVKIGLPPKGYKYVRVANDVLLIAIGSMMVIDAVEDLMRP